MTRDFNKQPRDDARPPFRNKPSNKFGEERSSRPARPRLNRETVDRAWESGAQTQHHDYHPRTTNGQPPRNGQRNGRYSEYSPNNRANGDRPYDNRSRGNNFEGNRPPYGNRSEGGRPPYGNNRPYGNRPEGRPYEGRPYGGRPENSRPYSSRPEGGRPAYGNNRYEGGNRSEGGRPAYGNNRYEGGNRPSYGNRYEGGNRPEGGRPPYGNNRYEGGNRFEGGRPSYGNRREYDREGNTGPRPYDPQRNANYRSNDQPDGQSRERRGNFRGNDRGGYQSRFANDRNQDREFRRDEPRPPFREGRRDSFPEEPRQPASRGRYEGDYEGLDEKTAPRPAPYFRNGKPQRDDEEQVEERHVTRMPDGRVLKGPRPAQRKNERFWKNVADDTENLVSQIHTVDNQDEAEAEEQLLTTLEHLAEEPPVDTLPGADDVPETTDVVDEVEALDEPVAITPQPARKPRTRTAASREEKKAAAEKKPRATVIKPSQRGFKWPTP